ncbi:hypothetical protein V6N13_129642 [Hibiscus sabdariffa]|uniref:Uncharacterized protein n=1 Tax=Hibiscus sabdariffa TaxID=183260 RepID=A0ABR2SMB9_9ROSI
MRFSSYASSSTTLPRGLPTMKFFDRVHHSVVTISENDDPTVMHIVECPNMSASSMQRITREQDQINHSLPPGEPLDKQGDGNSLVAPLSGYGTLRSDPIDITSASSDMNVDSFVVLPPKPTA